MSRIPHPDAPGSLVMHRCPHPMPGSARHLWESVGGASVSGQRVLNLPDDRPDQLRPGTRGGDVGGRSGHPARPVDLLLAGIVSVVAGCGGNDLGQAAASSRPTTSTAGTTTTRATATSATAAHTVTTTRPRRSGGYFRLVPAGRWSVLPSGATCRHRVHASSWEPRPDNTKRNHVMPDSAAVHAAFAARPRAAGGAADPRWDSWLLARVDGRFTGTTDEIFQWGPANGGCPTTCCGPSRWTSRPGTST
jgi:hypothetical protein